MKKIFSTCLYSEVLVPRAKRIKLNRQILLEAEDIQFLDGAGKFWSKENYRNGYTSYASANSLHKTSPTFRELELHIDRHVSKFARQLDFNLGGKPLHMVSCWLNIMQRNASHSMHMHPLSVISGTYYVSTPRGSSPIKFEDPRHALFMSAPPKKEGCREYNRAFVEVPAEEGRIVLFESWLRHEVPQHLVRSPRVSISFNYAW